MIRVVGGFEFLVGLEGVELLKDGICVGIGWEDLGYGGKEDGREDEVFIGVGKWLSGF